MATDRPDFTEASSTVGRGRVQLEAGYTFASDRSGGVRTTSHSYPEALLRVGLFADWFEFRVGQNFGSVRAPGPAATAPSLPIAPTDTSSGTTPTSGTFSANGAEDLYLGVKLALTEQKEFSRNWPSLSSPRFRPGIGTSRPGGFSPGSTCSTAGT